MSLNLVTPAATYPVTPAELKAHLAIDGTDHDTRLTALIAAATAWCEKETGRAFVTQTWDYTLPCFPWNYDGVLWLPKPPVQSITYVKYYDTDNVQQTLDTGDYYQRLPSEAQAYLVHVDDWPDTYDRPDAVTVRMVCGFVAQPPLVQHAIKLLCGAWNELREGEVSGTITKQTELGVARILGLLNYGNYQ